MPLVHPKWVIDLIMNLLWDVQQGTQLSSAQHLNIVPPVVRDQAGAILGYLGQQHAASTAFESAVAAAPAQDGADGMPAAPEQPPGAASPDPQTLPVTPVMPQASVPANSAGR